MGNASDIFRELTAKQWGKPRGTSIGNKTKYGPITSSRANAPGIWILFAEYGQIEKLSDRRQAEMGPLANDTPYYESGSKERSLLELRFPLEMTDDYNCQDLDHFFNKVEQTRELADEYVKMHYLDRWTAYQEYIKKHGIF